MTAVKHRLKKGDYVIVRSGSHKGKIGEILSVLKDSNAVKVQGVNVVTRNRKPSAGHEGGQEQITKPIHMSNVAYYDSEMGAFSRLTYQIDESGLKRRVMKKTNKVLEG